MAPTSRRFRLLPRYEAARPFAFRDPRRCVACRLCDDERVILYDAGREQYWVIEDPAEELRDALDDDAYAEALDALGITPVIAL